MNSVRSEIRQKIEELRRKRGRLSEFADSDPIFLGSLLDSLSALQLIFFLEDRYGFFIPKSGLTIHELNSVDALVRAIEERA